jgi:hypothetical protein
MSGADGEAVHEFPNKIISICACGFGHLGFVVAEVLAMEGCERHRCRHGSRGLL